MFKALACIRIITILLSVLLQTSIANAHTATHLDIVYVQVGVFRFRGHADRSINDIYGLLHVRGFIKQVYHRSSPAFKKPWYYVEFGPYKYGEARAFIAKLKAKNLTGIAVPVSNDFLTNLKVPTSNSAEHRRIKIVKSPGALYKSKYIEIRPPKLKDLKDNKINLTSVSDDAISEALDNARIQARMLSLREAILLSLRYNTSIQNAEIDRITQKFQLDVRKNDFELRYALAGTGNFTRTKSEGVLLPDSTSYALVPELKYKTPLGTDFSLQLNNFYDGFRYNPQLTFKASQPFLRGAGIGIVQAQLNDAYDTEEQNKLTLKNNIIIQVNTIISDFRTVITDNNNIRTGEQNLAQAIKTLDDNVLRIKAGRLPTTGNIEQQSQVESLRLGLENTRNTRDQDLQSLLKDIGLDPEIKIKVPDDVSVINPKIPNQETAINLALHNNVDYQKTLINYRQTKRAVKVSKNAQLPSFDANLTYSAGSLSGVSSDSNLVSLVNGRNHVLNVNFSFDIPINDLPRQQQYVDAKVNLEKSRLNLIDAKRTLIINVKKQIIEIRSRIKSMQLATSFVDLARQSFGLERLKNQYGRSTQINVTTAQNRLIAAQISLINAKISYLNALTALENTLGITLDKWKIQLRY